MCWRAGWPDGTTPGGGFTGMLNYSLYDADGMKIMALSGSITISTCAMMRNAVRTFVEKESLVINMENVVLVTSAGLDVLVELSMHAKEYNRRIIILWPGKDLMQMVEKMGLYQFMTFAQSYDEARMKIKFFT